MGKCAGGQTTGCVQWKLKWSYLLFGETTKKMKGGQIWLFQP